MAGAERILRTGQWGPTYGQRTLGEQPVHRRAKINGNRPRALVLMAISLTASVLLVLGMTDGIPSPHSGSGPGIHPAQAKPPPSAPTVTAAPDPSSDETVDPSAPPPLADPSASGTAPGPTATIPSNPAAPIPGRPPSNPPAPDIPAPSQISIEAEGPQVVRGGQTHTRSLSTASGGAVVSGIGTGSANLVRITGITVNTAGRHLVTFCYFSPEHRRATVLVNGKQQTVQFFATGSNPERVGTVSVPLKLVSGSNTIEFTNKNAPAPDLDRVLITFLPR